MKEVPEYKHNGLMVAVGMFDGMHRGHRYVVDRLRECARERGLGSGVVTFTTHPLAVIAPGSEPALLQPARERLAILRHSGVDRVIALDFTPALRALTAREFMLMLRRDYGVRAIFMGYDHRFGSDRITDPARYEEIAAELGIEIVRGAEARLPEGHVSSSVVRRALSAGNVAEAAASLGRPYRLSGTVESGHRIGRTIGFPTANLAPEEPRQLIPAAGVYACRATIDDGAAVWPAMVNIGTRPTVDDGGRQTVEAHLIGYEGDLYGRRLTLEFIARLRSEHRFDTLEALSRQLAADRAAALQLLITRR